MPGRSRDQTEASSIANRSSWSGKAAKNCCCAPICISVAGRRKLGSCLSARLSESTTCASFLGLESSASLAEPITKMELLSCTTSGALPPPEKASGSGPSRERLLCRADQAAQPAAEGAFRSRVEQEEKLSVQHFLE